MQRPITNPEAFISKITERIERDSERVKSYFEENVCKICMKNENCHDMPMKCSHKICKMCYFKINVCPFCRTTFKSKKVMDLSKRQDLSNTPMDKPISNYWGKCSIWVLIDIVDKMLNMNMSEWNDKVIVYYCKRINEYINRNLFVKRCFIIDGKYIQNGLKETATRYFT